MSALNFQAIAIDLDGLVLDTETGYFSAWQAAADAVGYSLEPTFCASLSGAHGEQISRHLLRHFGPEFPLERFYGLSSQIWHQRVQVQGIPVKKGFHALLETLKALELPYCLATNSRRSDALNCLAWSGLEGVFALLVSREDVANPKPAADIFLRAADLLQTAPPSCLVLEDSPVGMEAAVAGGCPCYFVPSITPADPLAEQMADRVFADLDLVADFISAAFHPSL